MVVGRGGAGGECHATTAIFLFIYFQILLLKHRKAHQGKVIQVSRPEATMAMVFYTCGSSQGQESVCASQREGR